MSAPTTAVQLRDVLPFELTESRGGAAAPLLLHTPGPIPPVDDEDDDDEADKQWARQRNASFVGVGARFVL